MMLVEAKWDLPRPVKLTDDDFFRLDAAGAFEAYSKTELIDGTIVAMNAQYARHVVTKTRLAVRLHAAGEPLGLEMLVEATVRLSETTIVEPDVLLFDGKPYEKALPANSLRLVVEVADSTRDYDLGQKARAYALAGVREYWIADLQEDRFLLLTEPNMDGSWNKQSEIAIGDPITALTIPGLTVDTAGLG